MWILLLQCTEVPVVTGRVPVRDLAIYKHFFGATGFLNLKNYFLDDPKSTQVFFQKNQKKVKFFQKFNFFVWTFKMTINALYEDQYDSKCAYLHTKSFWLSILKFHFLTIYSQSKSSELSLHKYFVTLKIVVNLVTVCIKYF